MLFSSELITYYLYLLAVQLERGHSELELARMTDKFKTETAAFALCVSLHQDLIRLDGLSEPPS